MPIENSTEGVVAHTLDSLVDSDLQICAEIYLDIHHNLLSRSGKDADVQRIHLPSSGIGAMPRLAGAALPYDPGRRSREHRPRRDEGQRKTAHLAAISSAMAKEVYNLQTVAANIEDQSNNITRFVVIGKMRTKPSRDDKTSLVFSVQDKPGVLHPDAATFARSRINLTKIESRPIKNKPWEYLFFSICAATASRAR